jgi:small GTP-binding protein
MANPIQLKISFLGNTGVGKTYLLLRYTEDDFPKKNTMPTIGIEYKTKTIIKNNQTLNLQIWTSAGQERYHQILRSTFLRRVNGIVLVYDLTERSSFMNIENWMNQIREKAEPGTQIVLVANKLDLIQEREFTEGRRIADTFGIPFFAVSAKTGEGVSEMFESLTDMILLNNLKILNNSNAPAGNRLTQDSSILDSVKCCVW